MKAKILLTAFLLCTVWMSYGQWNYTNLTEAKSFMGSVTLGNKAYFAGGYNGTTCSSLVEVYDLTTGTWSTAGNLSVARELLLGTTTCGSKIFFAGGYNLNVSLNTVDVFDTSTQQWTVEQLSAERFSIASVSYGSKVLFAGGVQVGTSTARVDIVDIYDIATDVWSIDHLSVAREGIAAAVVGDLAIFAGGLINGGQYGGSNRVDIYNFTTNTWSIDSLSQARGYASAVTIGNKVIIAGGATSVNHPTDRVDIYDASTGTWSTTNISHPRCGANIGANLNGKAFFAGGGNFKGNGFNNPSSVVDIYDPVTGNWSVDSLMHPLVGHSVAGVGNKLVVAGGETTGGFYVSLVEIYTELSLIHIPADFPTIQQGIVAATPGDTVLVAPGTYFENINFLGKKPLLVASQFIMDGDTNHIANTIINGSQPLDPDIGSVVTFESGEDTTSVLCGFTITGGTGTLIGMARVGGGVFMQYSGGKLLNNHIENNIINNEGWTFGGGICAGAPISPLPWVVLRGNRISNNKAISFNDEGDGGGADIWYNLIMENNEVSWNEAEGPYRGDGGGVRCRSDLGHTEVLIRNNNITHNKATSVSESTDVVLTGGLSIFWDCSGIISGNNVSFNEIEAGEDKGGYGTGILIDNNASEDVVLENNLIEGNTFTGGFLNGGGLCIYRSSVLVQNNIIKDNTGTNGGGIYVETPDDLAVLMNNTIVGNHGDNGGGLHATDANAVIVNTIFWGNTATLNGTSIFEEGSTLEVRYSDVEGDVVWPGDGNVNCHATFLDDGYHLSDTCQLVESGIASIEINGVWYNCPAYDIDGEGRPSNAFPEIGADEVLIESVPEPTPVNDLAFNIYPNPASGKITIELSDETTAMMGDVSIIGLTGKELLRQQVTGPKTEFNVSALPAGVYFIKLINNDQNAAVKVGKFVKK